MRIGHLASYLAISVLALGCVDHQLADLTDVDRLTADVVSGNVVQLSSPDEFSEGAFTIDFEGLGNIQLGDQFVGLTFSPIFGGTRVLDPAVTFLWADPPSTATSGTAAAVDNGVVRVDFDVPIHEVGTFVSFTGIFCCTAGDRFRDVFLIAFDDQDDIIGGVRVPVRTAASDEQQIRDWEPVLIGLRSASPISAIRIDDRFPPLGSGGSVIVYDDLTFSPPSPQQLIGLIVESVEDLVVGGVLKAGQANGLIKKLEEAIKVLEMGNVQPAIQKLGDFIDQVQSYINRGKFTSGEGQPLIDAAQSVIEELSG